MSQASGDSVLPESVRLIVVDAMRWWGSKRPVGWGNAEHERHPTVNCATEVEKDLALSVASHFGSRGGSNG